MTPQEHIRAAESWVNNAASSGNGDVVDISIAIVALSHAAIAQAQMLYDIYQELLTK